MPTWRADYFDKARDQAPTRSVTIEAERDPMRSIKRAPRCVQPVLEQS